MSKKTYVPIIEQEEESYINRYHFIRVEGNEKELNYLIETFNFKWKISEGQSIFSLSMESIFTEDQTIPMLKLPVDDLYPHTRFDGTLRHINFKIGPHDDNYQKSLKISKKLQNNLNMYVTNEYIVFPPSNFDAIPPSENNV